MTVDETYDENQWNEHCLEVSYLFWIWTLRILGIDVLAPEMTTFKSEGGVRGYRLVSERHS